MGRFLPVGLCVAFAACAPIQHSQVVQQPTGATLSAGPGDVLVRVDKQRNLENVSGNADIFGRKTNEGFSALYFAGVSPSGAILLYRNDVQIVSNETTMSRSPFASSYTSSSANGSATLVGNTVYGQANGTSTTLSTVPLADYHAVLPQGAIPIALPAAPQEVAFEGMTVTVLTASAGRVTYRISK